MHRDDTAFLNVVPQPVWIYDIDSLCFLAVNRAATALYGYSEAEFLAMTILDIRPAADVPDFQRFLSSAVMRTDSLVETGVRTHVKKDGSSMAVNVCSQFIHFEGHLARVAVAHDVTERLRTESQIKDYLERLQKALSSTIDAICHMMALRDPYTAGHEARVADLACAIGKEMGLTEDGQEALRVAGIVHDIGKISIPAEILAKPTELSAAEYDIVKKHPESGFAVLSRIDFPWPVAEVSRQHHERIDGSGYPRGIKGEDILLEARITAVADVVEAMSSHRPYRASQGLEVALQEIEHGAGTRYDPAASGACLKLFREQGYQIAPWA
jgi:PAS domain S-box-containing protein